MHQDKTFPPIEKVTSPAVTTDAAAFYLNRKSQTLRKWSHMGSGPIRPMKVNGRLAWPIAEIKSLMGID